MIADSSQGATAGASRHSPFTSHTPAALNELGCRHFLTAVVARAVADFKALLAAGCVTSDGRTLAGKMTRVAKVHPRRAGLSMRDDGERVATMGQKRSRELLAFLQSDGLGEMLAAIGLGGWTGRIRAELLAWARDGAQLPACRNMLGAQTRTLESFDAFEAASASLGPTLRAYFS